MSSPIRDGTIACHVSWGPLAPIILSPEATCGIIVSMTTEFVLSEQATWPLFPGDRTRGFWRFLLTPPGETQSKGDTVSSPKADLIRFPFREEILSR